MQEGGPVQGQGEAADYAEDGGQGPVSGQHQEAGRAGRGPGPAGELGEVGEDWAAGQTEGGAGVRMISGSGGNSD